MTTDDRAMFTTMDQAPDGFLKWFFPDDDGNPSEETIPLQHGFHYELTYDGDGDVTASVVMRDDEGQPIGGVQLTRDDMMDFARWAFQTNLSIADLKGHQLRSSGLDSADVAARAHMSAHVDDLLAFIRNNLPTDFERVVNKEAQRAIERSVDRSEREAEIRTGVAVAKALAAQELKHARTVVQLSQAATVPVQERAEMLDDPILQEAILKSVNCLADSQRA